MHVHTHAVHTCAACLRPAMHMPVHVHMHVRVRVRMHTCATCLSSACPATKRARRSCASSELASRSSRLPAAHTHAMQPRERCTESTGMRRER